MRKRIEVKAVWDSQLKDLLGDLGILEPLLLGELTCAQCGRMISLDNLGAIIPQRDNVILVCDNTPCVHALTRPEVASPDE
jgi:hypothetical protein